MTPSNRKSGGLVPVSGRQLAAVGAGRQPAGDLSALGGRRETFWEFFTANIRNRNTRRAYFVAVSRFSEWCELQKTSARSTSSRSTSPHISSSSVATHCQAHRQAAPGRHPHAVRLARHRPGHSHEPGARGARPRHSVKKGRRRCSRPRRWAQLLDSIDITSMIGLRDRALIALMGYTFARVGAAVAMKVEDYYIQKRRGWVRLHEKGGKVTELPCHHNLEQYLDECLERVRPGRRTDRSPVPDAAAWQAHRPHSPAAGQRPYDDPAAGRSLPASGRRSALTASAPPASPHICRTAASSKSRSRWPGHESPARPGSTTGATTQWRSMRSRESRTDPHPCHSRGFARDLFTG